MERNKSVICRVTLEQIVYSNRHIVGIEDMSEYHLRDFDNYPEGWDCVFMSCPSWDELDSDERKERREVLETALSKF